MAKICFIDFETTGSNPNFDQALQFGATLIDNESLTIINEYQTNICPDKKVRISEKAFEIHGIDYSQLKMAPSPSEFLSKYFNEIGTDYCFAAWNIGFDVSIFRRLCFEYNFMTEYNQIQYRHIDVQTLGRICRDLGIIPDECNSLSKIARFFSINRAEQHNALEDSKLAYNVYINLLNKLKSNIVIHAPE